MFVVFALALVVAGVTEATPNDGIAVTSSGIVSRSELEEWQQYRRGTRQPEDDSREGLETLVILKALDARARQLGLDQAPDLLERRRHRELEAAIAVLKSEVARATRPTDEAILQHYEENRERWRLPRRWRLENLFKRFPIDASKADRRRLSRDLEGLRERVLAGEDFAALVRQESDSTSGSRGGRLGVVRLEQLAPEFRAPVSELRAGGMTPVIESVDGLTVLRCSEFFDAQDIPYESARRRIGPNLHRSVFETAWEELTEALLMQHAAETRRAAGGGGGVDFTPEVPHRELIERLLVQEARARGLLDTEEIRRDTRFAAMELNAEAALDHDAAALVVPPTPEDVDEYFENNRQRFQEPERRLLHAAVVELSAGVPREALRALELAGDEVRRGVRKLREVATGLEHGEFLDLGWRTRRDLSSDFPDLVPVAFKLEKGQLSDVLQQDGRLVLLQLVDVQPPRELALGEVRERVEELLMRSRLEAAKQTVRASVLASQQPELPGEETSR